MSIELRHDWTRAQLREVHDLPLMELLYRAQSVHRESFGDHKVQLCSLLSVKTGGCAEDCGYCPQAARYHTGVESEQLMSVDDVLVEARRARDNGATRFCMGAAWREAKDGQQFDDVLEMVSGVRALGMEACATLGMLTRAQAGRLADAGLTAYNHNLDTSPEFYGEIITTRHYEDRLQTLQYVRESGVQMCCGGIIGMGESIDDRMGMLSVLTAQDPHPESVPVNALVPVEGTPLGDRPPVETLEMVRMIATARISMPRSMVRLSAGRLSMSEEAQLLCILAGANSIFFGDRLLVTDNPSFEKDREMLKKAGLEPLEPAVQRRLPRERRQSRASRPPER